MKWKSLKQRKIEHLMAQSKWHTFRPWWPVTAETARTGTHPIGTTIWLEHVARLKIGKATYYAPLTVLLTDPYEVEQEELRKKLQGQQAQQIGQAMGGVAGHVGFPNQILQPPGGGMIGVGVAPYFPAQQYGQLQGQNPLGAVGGLAQQAGNLSHQQMQNDFLNAIYQAGGNGNGGSGS